VSGRAFHPGKLTTECLKKKRTGVLVALERVGRLGDLFAPVLEEPRPLGAAAKVLARLDPQPEANHGRKPEALDSDVTLIGLTCQ